MLPNKFSSIFSWAAVGLLKAALLIAAIACATPATAEPTITCPTGMYDMLDWMTMDADLRSAQHLNGNDNPMYTVVEPGKFYWIKGAEGYPWDIQLYDDKSIYLWITELSWNYPESYKKFTDNTNVPLVARCANAGFPGSTIKVTNSRYDVHTNCSQKDSTTLNVENVINQVWGPYYLSFGGNLPNNLKTLVISYQYSCDENFQNCFNKEEFYVNQRYGLVQWIHYTLSHGNYEQQKKSTFNQLAVGMVKPDFPCF